MYVKLFLLLEIFGSANASPHSRHREGLQESLPTPLVNLWQDMETFSEDSFDQTVQTQLWGSFVCCVVHKQ